MTYRERLYEYYGRAFQDTSECFDSAAARKWARAYKWYFRGWLPQNGNARIVDLGCGGGRLLFFFKERGFDNCLGVDISPDQVLLAKQVTNNVLHENAIDYICGQKEAVDFIAALDLIEHLTKDELLQFFDGCIGALSPGGRVVFQTPNADSPFGLTHRYNDLTHEIGFNSNLLTRLMKLAGFVGVETREMGPVPFGYSLVSTIRYPLWQCIRTAVRLWNVVETGHPGSGVYTRIILASGEKP